MFQPKPAQDLEEFDQFCQLMVAENVRSYLEIGSWKGGSIMLAAKVLPKGSRLVSVDKMLHESLQTALKDLKQNGYDTHQLLGDSMDPKTIAAAKALGPYDAVFIDGDHRIEYVTSDWVHYGQMCRIVAFHDIARDMPADNRGGPHQVNTFWKQFDKTKYRHAEIVSELTRTRTDTKAAYGIGVVWRQ